MKIAIKTSHCVYWAALVSQDAHCTKNIHLLSSPARYKVTEVDPNRILLRFEPKSKNGEALPAGTWNSCEHALTSILCKAAVRCPGPKPILLLTLPTLPWCPISSGSCCCKYKKKKKNPSKYIFKNPQKISQSCEETRSWTKTGRKIQNKYIVFIQCIL